jgi:hypothetical protein
VNNPVPNDIVMLNQALSADARKPVYGNGCRGAAIASTHSGSTRPLFSSDQPTTPT